MKTSDLTGAALDWAVAKCEGAGAALVQTHSRGEVLLLSDHTTDCDVGDHYQPSTDWAQGGPIIQREEIGVRRTHEDSGWTASKHVAPATVFEEGSTPLIAAMRCFVASKLGDEVEIPKELKGA